MEDYVLLHIILLRIELLRGILIMEILQPNLEKFGLKTYSLITNYLEGPLEASIEYFKNVKLLWAKNLKNLDFYNDETKIDKLN
jgi:hypothetical protein